MTPDWSSGVGRADANPDALWAGDVVDPIGCAGRPDNLRQFMRVSHGRRNGAPLRATDGRCARFVSHAN